MKRALIRLGLLSLAAASMFGCGGGSDGAPGATVTVPINVSNKQTIASNVDSPSTTQVQAWRALEPKVTVTSVTIASPPVVNFAVTDANGNAVVGLGNKSQASTARVAGLTNLRFTLAKLVPSDGTSPSRWVSYLVVKPTTVAQAAGTIPSTESCNTEKTWCGTYPTTDQEGTLVDNGDGTYKYTFYRDITQVANIVANLPNSGDGLKKKGDLDDLSYNATLTHRLGIQISGAAPGTGSNTPNAATLVPATNIAIPTNITYDFRPDGQAVTSTRTVVDKTSCDSCHNGKGLAHGQGRNDPNYCATCHTDQVKYGMSGEASRTGTALSGTTQNTTSVLEGRAIGNMPNFFHKIHMGSELTLTGYNYIPNSSGVGLNFKETEWIQDPRDCTKCHSGNDKTDINQATKTKDGNNWKTKPSRLACGACHDNVSFTSTAAVGTVGTDGLIAHTGGTATDDSTCASCHAAGATPVAGGAAVAPVDVAHKGEAPTANNPAVMAGAATISYEIKSVAVTAGVAKITFRILKDGAPVSSFNTPVPTQSSSTGVYSVPSNFQAIDGFTGGPTFYVVYAVPQDGIAAPADYNTYQSVSLTNMLVTSGYPKAGSLSTTGLSAADIASGYLVATLTGSEGQLATTAPTTPIACPEPATKLVAGYCASPSLIKIPTTAKMVTGAMIGTFKQVTFATGTKAFDKFNATGLVIKTPLQQKVATGYTGRRVVVDTNRCESCHEQLGAAVDFHGGARNDATSCAICHNPNRTSSGWSANASTFVHGIHAGTSPSSVTAAKAAGTVGNPGTGVGGAGLAFNAGKRYVPFSWHRDAAGWNAAAVVYPGILKKCDSCHVPNAVNFGANGSSLLPNLLWSTSGTGKYNGVGDSVKAYPRDPVTGSVIYIDAGNVTNYGNVFAFTPEGSAVARVTPATGVVTPANSANLVVAPAQGTTIAADAATLVESPVSSACFACHDTSTAQAHMRQYGGVLYGARSASFAVGTANLENKETCLVCHGMGRDADAAVVHNKK